MFKDKSILITGGTGSFGRKFIQTVLDRYEPRRVIVFSRDELKQFEMSQQIHDDRMRYFIGDIRDAGRLSMAMEDVDIVVHAAALKQVPALEYNPSEAIKTNINGTENVVTAALNQRVDRVIALSTDKAAAPINLYGATKLAGDKLVVAANNIRGKSQCKFSVVRYGNVIGSRGSVIPFFQKLVAQGAKELPITDPTMTRFLITLEQGVDFVIDALKRMQGGEIFVPKIPSADMVTIANAIGPGLAHTIVGARPGEKKHELMCPVDLASSTYEFDKFYLIKPSFDFTRKVDYSITTDGQRGEKVALDFEYNSFNNPIYLDERELQNIMSIASNNPIYLDERESQNFISIASNQ